MKNQLDLLIMLRVLVADNYEAKEVIDYAIKTLTEGLEKTNSEETKKEMARIIMSHFSQFLRKTDNAPQYVLDVIEMTILCL